jgi:hypothetical protein
LCDRQTLTLPEDGAANCLYVNGTLIHRSRDEAPKSDAVRSLLRFFVERIFVDLNNLRPNKYGEKSST